MRGQGSGDVIEGRRDESPQCLFGRVGWGERARGGLCGEFWWFRSEAGRVFFFR